MFYDATSLGHCNDKVVSNVLCVDVFQRQETCLRPVPHETSRNVP